MIGLAHRKNLYAKRNLEEAREALKLAQEEVTQAEIIFAKAQEDNKEAAYTHIESILQDVGNEWNAQYQKLKNFMGTNERGSDSLLPEKGKKLLGNGSTKSPYTLEKVRLITGQTSDDDLPKCADDEKEISIINDGIDDSHAELIGWTNRQRTLYRTDELESYQVEALNQIKFIWSKQDKNMAALVAFKERFGHFKVPTNYKENPTLGNWVRMIRARSRAGTTKDNTTQSVIDELNSIGFTWDLYQDHFNNMFRKLMEYKIRYGHCHVDNNDTENLDLVKFVKEMRVAYLRFQKPRRKLSREILTTKRIDLLEAEGFQWNTDGVKWYKKYLELVKFQKKFGACAVSKSYDLELYNFVNIQRRDYRIRKNPGDHHNGISDKRMKLLADIGFVFVVENGKGRPIKKTIISLELKFHKL